MNRLLVLFLLSFLVACTNKAIYDNIQLNNRNDCIKEPPPLYEKCMERTNKSYQEYQREKNKGT